MTTEQKSVEHQQFDMKVKYQSVFGSGDGRIVLKHMLKTCHFMNTTLSDSPYETHYKEGERSFLIRILQTLQIDPDQMLTLIDLGNQQEEQHALD